MLETKLTKSKLKIKLIIDIKIGDENNTFAKLYTHT